MNDNLVITGRVIKILDMISGDSKKNPGTKWYKQEYVIETQTNYPRQICFGIFGEDRIKDANIQLNEMISVQIDIDSREYNGKWYTNVNAYNVMKLGNSDMLNNFNGTPNNQTMPDTENDFSQNNDYDDLPF